MPPPSAADRERHLKAGGHAAASLGLTTVTDMGIGAESAAAYRALQARHELPVRVAAFWSGSDPRLLDWLSGGPWRSDDAFLSMRGVKLYADGALGSRGAALVEPYSDDPGNLGLVVTPSAELQRVAAAARKGGFQVAIHAIGDRGNLVALDALEAAFEGVPAPGAALAHRARADRPPPGPRAHGQARRRRLDAAHPRHLRHAVGAGPARRLAARPRLPVAQRRSTPACRSLWAATSRSSGPTRCSASTPR